MQRKECLGLFLISISDKKEDILSTTDLTKNNKFSRLENQYVAMINTGKNIENSPLSVAHETAKVLYKRYQPIGTLEAGLFLLWFTVFVEMSKQNVSLTNNTALASAVEYLWKKLRNEKCSQKEMAEQYNISTSTLQKYIKRVNDFLQ